MFKLRKTFPGPFHLLDCYPSIVYRGDPPDHDFTDAMDDADDKPLNELLSHHMVDLYVGPSRTHWVLHEKLLRARSAHFARLLSSEAGKSKTVQLPDEDESIFALLVAWLYSASMPPAASESDLGRLLELHALGERWRIPALARAVLGVVRDFYRRTDSFPALRRLQYVCGDAEGEGGGGGDDGELRRLMVDSVARMLVLGEEVPPHWERALRRDGAMAMDIIRAVRTWRLEPENVPDARWEGAGRKRVPNGVVRNGKTEEMQEEASEGEQERSELGAVAAPRDDETLVNGLNDWHH